jgi:hypothetical protein
MNLSLNDSERAAIRALPGGVAYVAILAVRGPRGAKYRPVRSAMWRTEEQGAKALADLRRRFVAGRQLDAWSGVYLVDVSGEAIEIEDVEIPTLPPVVRERTPEGRDPMELISELTRALDRA